MIDWLPETLEKITIYFLIDPYIFFCLQTHQNHKAHTTSYFKVTMKFIQLFLLLLWWMNTCNEHKWNKCCGKFFRGRWQLRPQQTAGRQSTWFRTAAGSLWNSNSRRLCRKILPVPKSCGTHGIRSSLCGSICPAPATPRPNTSSCSFRIVSFLIIPKYSRLVHVLCTLSLKISRKNIQRAIDN